jgi:hypothetical protein
MDLTNEVPDDAEVVETVTTDMNGEEAVVDPAELQHVKRVLEAIKSDKQFHDNAFRTMRRDMFMARKGYDPKEYPGKTSYVANICGRHVKQKTAALYAKNPKAIARRKERMDFAVWDEDPKSLQLAMQTVQLAQQAIAGAQMAPDPMTGAPTPVLPEIPPEIQAAFEEAQSVIADYQQGMARRKAVDKLGKTLEILYAQAISRRP